MTLPRRLLWLLVALAAAFAGCDAVMLSPRQKLVKDATQAMCDARSLKGMLPFVTEKSKPVLELASSMAELGSVFKGQNLADRIAVECAGGDMQFLDEVKVSDSRYLVRTRGSAKADVTETVVVLENGQWKIAFDGK